MKPTENSKRRAIIAPSILSANFAKLGEEIASVEKAGADWIHIDVMDGHFVPNLTFGPFIVKQIRSLTKLPFDCHLMVSKPEDWIVPFAEAGADTITVHVEGTAHLDRLIHKIRDQGCKAGISLNPATSLTALEEVLDIIDLVLIMSVNPGFGGQKFIANALSKVERLSDARGDREFLIEVDGGINAENIAPLFHAGADVFVAGNAIFGEKDRIRALARIRDATREKRKTPTKR